MYPIPTQYGMTIGELAKMIIGEELIAHTPQLLVIPMEKYYNTTYFDETHSTMDKTIAQHSRS